MLIRCLLLAVCAFGCGDDNPDCRIPPYDAGADADPPEDVVIDLPKGCDTQNLQFE